jgi:protein-tyrosine phosphatase
MDEGFAILVVCHANMCRSPMAERLIRHAIMERVGSVGAGFEVCSAGTRARTGLPMHPHSAAVLYEAGVDEAGFGSQCLTTDLIARADLVLTATRDQRATCVSRVPAAVRRTFTLPQFGRLAAEMPRSSLTAIWPPQARLRALIDQLPAIRSTVPVAPGDADDLPDPVNGPIEAFRDCARQIQRVVDTTVGLL